MSPTLAPALIQAATFDLDDTLWSEHAVLDRANELFHQYIARCVPTVASRFPPAAFVQQMARVQRERPRQAHDFTFLRKHTLRCCLAQVDVALLPAELQTPEQREAFVEAAFEVFVVARSKPTPFAGVDAMLDDVRTQVLAARAQDRVLADGPDAVLGVITNGNTRWDLLPPAFTTHFDFIVSAEMVGKPKPAHEIFDAALAHFPKWMPRNAVVYVGDHYEHDVVGAKQAGWRTIWMNLKWPHDEVLDCHAASNDDIHAWKDFPAADAIIKDPRSVSAVIKLWNANVVMH